MKLTMLAIGVVYVDIGTSPLYAIKECFKPEHGLVANEANVLGVLSLIVWALIIIVSIKYIVFIMQADNRGEGGEPCRRHRVQVNDRPRRRLRNCSHRLHVHQHHSVLYTRPYTLEMELGPGIEPGAQSRALGLLTDERDTTYFLGRERLLPTGRAHLARWRKKVYIFMSRNSRTATEYFAIPPNRVVELGAQLEM